MSDSEACERQVLTPYDAIGGEAGVRRLVDAFYDAMDRDPAAAGIRAMHEPDLSAMRDRLSDWLAGWMGGPALYAQRHPGRPCIMSAHAPFLIGAEHAEQWMACMRQALAAAEAPEPWRGLLDKAFDRMCQGLRAR
jgi:hemoglobin